MNRKQIFENNQKWIDKKLQKSKSYFEDLIKGQNPHTLYIGCSDSRVTAEEIMGLETGEMFVVRNVANLVNSLDISIMSAIEYAVTHLKVSNIVVCGHYYCGGVRAAMTSEDIGIINPWLRSIRDVYRLHRQELDLIEEEHQRYMRLTELNVREQCFNLLKVATVQRAYFAHELEVYGWVFDMGSGKIIDLNLDIENLIKKIRAIYRLK